MIRFKYYRDGTSLFVLKLELETGRVYWPYSTVPGWCATISPQRAALTGYHEIPAKVAHKLVYRYRRRNGYTRSAL